MLKGQMNKPVHTRWNMWCTWTVTIMIFSSCRISLKGFRPLAWYLSQGLMKKYFNFLRSASSSSGDPHQCSVVDVEKRGLLRLLTWLFIWRSCSLPPSMKPYWVAELDRPSGSERKRWRTSMGYDLSSLKRYSGGVGPGYTSDLPPLVRGVITSFPRSAFAVWTGNTIYIVWVAKDVRPVLRGHTSGSATLQSDVKMKVQRLYSNLTF